MLKAFRNFTKSRYGLIAVFIFLAVIALAFAAGDITGLKSGVTGPSGSVLAKVGNTKITDVEVRDRIERVLREYREAGQPLTMADLIQRGGVDAILEDLIETAALAEFAQDSGMQVSKRLIDSDIASAPAFQGFDGKFDEKAFQGWLAEKRMSAATLYAEGSRERYKAWLLAPLFRGGVMPEAVALPYASMALERRQGVVGLIQTIAMDPGANPDAKTLAAYYASHQSRYMVPQRRIIRYALLKPDVLRAQSVATPAEIADAYAKAGTKYAATEKRSLEIVTALDQATATTIANAAKAGALDAAARASGLEVRKLDAAEKPAVARDVSPQFADAAFAAPANVLSGPAKIGTSWFVYRVAKVEKIAARSLDQVRAELGDEITQRKTAQALADLRQRIDDTTADKTFDELVRDEKLVAERTPLLTAQGVDPTNPALKPDGSLAPIVRAGFGVEAVGDESQLVPIAPDGTTALVSLERIVAAAPRPLAEIQADVQRDYLMDQALAKARQAATAALAKLEKGVPMAQVLAEAGATKGAPPKPFDFKRSELEGKEAYIRMAFSMQPKKAKLLEAPDRGGYYLVYLDKVEEHSAAQDRMLMANVRGALSQQVGAESARQFVRAVQNQVKVTRNADAIKRLREDLARTGAR